MLKTALSVVCLSSILFLYNEKQKEFPPIEEELPLIWKAPIGGASFRTNILFQKDQLIIGSNGSNFRDYGIMDLNSGVYILDRKTGKIKKRIAGQLLGDMDVNGVIEHNGKLYFGNDNEEFLCTSFDGKILWRNPTSGDIEHEPVLIKTAKSSLIVYASESGQVTAVNPESGSIIWNYFTRDYDGWKPGQNRAVFKVKAYVSNTSSFYTKPHVADLNRDGIADLAYRTYYGELIALNGANGRELWTFKREKHYLNFASHIDHNNGDPILEFIEYEYDEKYNGKPNIIRINRFGKLIREKGLGSIKYNNSLNYLKLGKNQVMLMDSDSIIVTNGDRTLSSIAHAVPFKKLDYNKDTVIENRNASTGIFASEVFSFRGHKRCVMIQFQHDEAFFEKGILEIVSLDTKEVLYRLQLPSAAEMEPVIKDVNSDGKLDVLINCYDGYLYCYSLGN